MKQLNPTQQQALETYRSTGELGILSNILIEDCLEELKNNLEARIKFDCTQLRKTQIRQSDKELGFGFGGRKFESLDDEDRILIVFKFLSRTPDGEAVMPFLDVETKEYLRISVISDPIGASEYFLPLFPKTLDHLLYREFTEALRTGKAFDESLEIVNKIYIDEIYV